MDAARRISRAKVRLMLHQPFWGHLAIHLEAVADPTIARGTMATDGSKLYYDPETVDTWTDDELTGGVAHEVGHPAFGHLWRRENRDFRIWNYSTDYALNLLLDKEGFELPRGVLLDHQYDNMSAEAVYSRLLDMVKQELATLDDPDKWQEATSRQSGQEKDKQSEHAGGRQEQQGEANSGTASSAQIWRQRVTQAAVAARVAGKLPAHIAALVEDVLAPILPWRVLLQEFIQQTKTDDYRMCPPNKKFLWMPLYMPSLSGEHLEIAVAIDTSGSTIPVRGRFAAEVEAILQQFSGWRVHLFMCDAAVDAFAARLKLDLDFPLTPSRRYPPERLAEARAAILQRLPR